MVGVRVRCDHHGLLVVGFLQGLDEPGFDRHEVLEAERERVCRPIGIRVVVGQLETQEDDEPVVPGGARGLGSHARRVGRPGPRIDCGRHRVVQANRMVGDAEHVEAVAPVEIDDLAERQLPVAPGRVRVQLAEQEIAAHRS